MIRLFAAVFFTIYISHNILSQENEATHLNWYTFEEVAELAKKDPRPVLIDVYTDWCGWCKKMDQDTYEHPAIVKYLNNNFYSIKFNAETKDTIFFNNKKFVNKRAKQRRGSHDLAVALLHGKMSYPSTVFLSENLQLLTAAPGYLNPENMEPILHFFAEEAYKKQSWEAFRKEFQSELK